MCLPLLHCALASCGAVYCNRSCLWACLQRPGGWAGGRCPNLTTASARAVFASLWALFSFPVCCCIFFCCFLFFSTTLWWIKMKKYSKMVNVVNDYWNSVKKWLQLKRDCDATVVRRCDYCATPIRRTEIAQSFIFVLFNEDEERIISCGPAYANVIVR